MLLLVSLANTGFASVPSCSKVTCPEPDLTIDGLRPGCSSRLAVNTSGAPMVGGTLYVHDLAGPWEWSQIVDLGDAAIASPAMRAAGERVVPRHKPHMVLPSPDQAYVAVTYTGDKFVHILDASTKEVVVSLDARRPAAGVVGGAMHAGAWHGNEHFIIVDMTGSVNDVAGGALHKYQVDVANGVSYHKASLAIGLSASDRGTTATKPIAMGGNAIGAFADLYFVTDAKGAGSIINGTSMTVVRNLPLADFGACTGGGLWIVPHPEISEVVIAQYGTVGGTQCLYQVNLKSLTITKTYALPTAADDAHGIAFCRASTGGHFLVNTNRASATLDVLDYETGAVVVDSFDLNGPFSSKVLQPDVIYLHQDGASEDSVLYLAARGPEPISAVKPTNFFPDALPGIFKLHLKDCVAPAFHETERNLEAEQMRVPALKPDVHSVSLVGTEVWAIDQAATGSMMTYEVYHKCGAYPVDS